MSGTITFFDRRRGWGFIDCPELQTDVFMHRSALPENLRGRHDLDGCAAEFDLGERAGRPVALNVQVVRPAAVAR